MALNLKRGQRTARTFTTSTRLMQRLPKADNVVFGILDLCANSCVADLPRAHFAYTGVVRGVCWTGNGLNGAAAACPLNVG